MLYCLFKIFGYKLGSIPYYNNQFGKGKRNMLEGNIECSGQETSLIQCSRIDQGFRNCTEDVAGVHCEGMCCSNSCI